MNKMLKNGLLMLAAGAFAVSCADYNETDNFKADPDPSVVEKYSDLAPVKTYIDRAKNPNISIDAAMKLTDFNKQALEHAAAITNFNGVSFGYSFMPASYVSKKGYMNFMALKEAVNHANEIGCEIYGSPIVANDQQPDGWFETLTAPIEVQVLPINDVDLDYSTVDEFTGISERGKATIVKNYDANGNVLKLPTRSMIHIIDNIDIDPLGYYTVTFTVKTEKDKDEYINCTFSGNKIMSGSEPKKYTIRPGAWQTVKVEAAPAEGVTNGYLMIERNLNTALYIRNVHVEHTPDNHRDQTKQEKNDTIRYALNKWCDGLMEANAGRIKTFDLIDKALDTKAEIEPGILDLKHSEEKIFWQDYLEDGTQTGSELYGAVVSKAAKAAFEKFGGDPAELQFFIGETGLENQKRLASLMYWINKWEANGAKIDGINAELNLTYSEDATKQAANKETLNAMLANLAATGKKIRLSNFDIKYVDAEGVAVAATKITEAQRQQLADYYAYVIKAYMTTIPNDKQAGLCKGNMVDTTDPVGLWAKDGTYWVRTATYEAFCKALSGQ